MKEKSHTQWDKLRKMKDSEIDFSDIPPLENQFFRGARLRLPESKLTVTMRLDPDVLKWFKSRGKKYQTRINAVLRMYMESQRSER